MQKKCAHCNEMADIRPDCRYCSNQCSGMAKRKRVDIACLACSKVFEVTPSKIKFGKKYCSQQCYENHGRSGDHVARFNSYLKLDPSTGCIEWTGCVNTGGYGNASVNGRNVIAHRFAYELYTGERIPKGIFVCHKCDNRKCCNIEHLWLATCKDNNDDRDQKGRNNQPKGSKNGKSKLQEWQVVEIKQKLQNSKLKDTHIARQYNVTSATIGFIKRGKIWKHVK